MSIFQAERQRRKDAEHRRQRNEIQKRLDEIDRLSIRPSRAVQAGTETQEDRDRLSELETEAQSLRDQLAEIPEPDTPDDA